METVQEVAPSSPPEERTDLCLCVTYLRATERAALAGARWLGSADQESAEEAAVSGMRSGLDELPMTGRVLIGAGDGETSMPETLGAGGSTTGSGSSSTTLGTGGSSAARRLNSTQSFLVWRSAG